MNISTKMYSVPVSPVIFFLFQESIEEVGLLPDILLEVELIMGHQNQLFVPEEQVQDVAMLIILL